VVQSFVATRVLPISLFFQRPVIQDTSFAVSHLYYSMLSFLVAVVVAVPVSFLTGKHTLTKINYALSRSSHVRLPDHNYILSTQAVYIQFHKRFLLVHPREQAGTRTHRKNMFCFKTNRQIKIQ